MGRPLGQYSYFDTGVGSRKHHFGCYCPRIGMYMDVHTCTVHVHVRPRGGVHDDDDGDDSNFMIRTVYKTLYLARIWEIAIRMGTRIVPVGISRLEIP